MGMGSNMKNNLKTLIRYLMEVETAKSRHLFENGVSGAEGEK
jgi:hypothetical protein